VSLCLCGWYFVSFHYTPWDKRVQNIGLRLGQPLSNSWRHRLEVEVVRHLPTFPPRLRIKPCA
jgi:hypothetical protein